jgi:uncharacterized protein YjbI with pentapeptide repeats
MSFDILNRWTSVVAYHSEKSTQREAILEAVEKKADLRSANLRGADLRSANLGGADLGGANLRDAYLGGADLGSANLRGADLGGADLRSANLRGADLGGADLGGANLRGANLGGANLGGFKMRGEITQFDCAEWANGHFLAYIEEKGTLRVICGCRHFSYEEAVTHWAGREDRKMTRVALSMAKVWFDAITVLTE